MQDDGDRVRFISLVALISFGSLDQLFDSSRASGFDISPNGQGTELGPVYSKVYLSVVMGNIYSISKC